MQLATQPFPFSLSHSHLVKLHLTFMSLFLNRKDLISRGHRHSLERHEFEKYKYQPRISTTQRSFSPNKERTPINEPNKYYDELKKNIRERAAKISSIRAEKERAKLDECTFRPVVNPKSTKIAYRQVAEMHIPQKEFTKTYMVQADDIEEENRYQLDPRRMMLGAEQFARHPSDDLTATVSATA